MATMLVGGILYCVEVVVLICVYIYGTAVCKANCLVGIFKYYTTRLSPFCCSTTAESVKLSCCIHTCTTTMMFTSYGNTGAEVTLHEVEDLLLCKDDYLAPRC